MLKLTLTSRLYLSNLESGVQTADPLVKPSRQNIIPSSPLQNIADCYGWWWCIFVMVKTMISVFISLTTKFRQKHRNSAEMGKFRSSPQNSAFRGRLWSLVITLLFYCILSHLPDCFICYLYLLTELVCWIILLTVFNVHIVYVVCSGVFILSDMQIICS